MLVTGQLKVLCGYVNLCDVLTLLQFFKTGILCGIELQCEPDPTKELSVTGF